MSEHECIIGLLNHYNNTKLVTVNELLEEINDDWSPRETWHPLFVIEEKEV